MAYNNKLRPRKKIKDCVYFGKFGEFDCSDGLKWKDFTEEMLLQFALLHDVKTVSFHLIGEIKEVKNTKKLSSKPDTSETPTEKK